jgi:hypothetical protein
MIIEEAMDRTKASNDLDKHRKMIGYSMLRMLLGGNSCSIIWLFIYCSIISGISIMHVLCKNFPLDPTEY